MLLAEAIANILTSFTKIITFIVFHRSSLSDKTLQKNIILIID